MMCPFVQARNYTPSVGRHIDLVVLHSMEAPEKPGRAMQVAQWFAGAQAPQASAHYCVDASQIIQCAREQDIAWAAPGANHNGLHVELAGYARQLPEDWADVYSASMLDRAVRLTAAICRRYNIPARVVGVPELLAGAKGITTHTAVSAAFKKSTHTDPGPGFPLHVFVQRVAEVLSLPAVENEP